MSTTSISRQGSLMRVLSLIGLRLKSILSRQTATTLLLAVALAFGMSTQYLAQLFVWREWPLAEVLDGWMYVLRDQLIVALAIALALSLLSAWNARSLAARTGQLALSVLAGAASGEWVVRLLYGEYGSIGSWLTHALRWTAVALAIAATYYLWRASVESRDTLRREDLRRQSVEQQLTNTHLTALRKQIEPHFLFNTLATVRRLHQTAPESGAAMLANFIDYLGRLLPMLEKSEVGLGEEADLIRAYLAVIQLRMLERLQVRVEVPVELRQARVPPLALATLVENAIKHGLSPLPEGGRIEVKASAEDGMLELAVRDNGVGLKPQASGGSGIGLYNVRSRLQTLHGARASLHVEPDQPTGVRAYMRLPLSLEAA